MKIVRKITIDSCMKCPFSNWRTETRYTYGGLECKLYDRNIDGKKYYNDEIESFCMLPVNIPSKKIIDYGI